MKSLNFTFIFIFSVFTVSFSQNLQIVYEFEIKIPERLDGLDPIILANLENNILTYQYVYTKNISQFFYSFYRKKDEKLGATFKAEKDTIFKDLNNRIIYSKSGNNSNLISKEPMLEAMTWELIEKEVKNICGYPCLKAKSVKNIGLIAWYAPDIPVPDGPMDTYGLPGMILQVEMPGQSFTAVKIEFPAAMPEIIIPKAEQFVTREEYKRLKQSNKH